MMTLIATETAEVISPWASSWPDAVVKIAALVMVGVVMWQFIKTVLR